MTDQQRYEDLKRYAAMAMQGMITGMADGKFIEYSIVAESSTPMNTDTSIKRKNALIAWSGWNEQPR